MGFIEETMLCSSNTTTVPRQVGNFLDFEDGDTLEGHIEDDQAMFRKTIDTA
jgi:hypothetical protein